MRDFDNVSIRVPNLQFLEMHDAGNRQFKTALILNEIIQDIVLGDDQVFIKVLTLSARYDCHIL